MKLNGCDVYINIFIIIKIISFVLKLVFHLKIHQEIYTGLLVSGGSCSREAQGQLHQIHETLHQDLIKLQEQTTKLILKLVELLQELMIQSYAFSFLTLIRAAK
jgi:hypothetical protein